MVKTNILLIIFFLIENMLVSKRTSYTYKRVLTHDKFNYYRFTLANAYFCTGFIIQTFKEFYTRLRTTCSQAYFITGGRFNMEMVIMLACTWGLQAYAASLSWISLFVMRRNKACRFSKDIRALEAVVVHLQKIYYNAWI